LKNETNMTRIWNKHKQSNTPLKRKVCVAMSGGVDSSVAALLLKKDGYDVTGVHMICWGGCENNTDKQDAMRVAAHLNIPFLTWDFRKEYKEAVFNYMISEYRTGRTPNPDVMCNKEIKFGIFLKRALEAGADFIATGHYVIGGATHHLRISASPQDARSGGHTKRDGASLQGFLSREKPGSFGARGLWEAKDSNKDQSYFLWTLTQGQLRHSLFPMGGYLKSEVREIAKKFCLPNADKKDSQGLCFVGKVDFAEFIREALPKRKGAVINSAGEVLGRHDGAEFFTIGQRHGLKIGGMPEPMYVAGRDILTNTLTVAENAGDPILYKKELSVSGLHWIAPPAAGQALRFPFECLARIRYRQPLQKARIMNDEFLVRFDEPQRAVAPGQSVVFYSDEKGNLPAGRQVLGGGIIN